MEVFDELDGYVTILHEFVHCYQFITCEAGLKQELMVAKQSVAAGDMLWEIQYEFPYEDPEFTILFERFISSISVGDLAMTDELQRDLKSILSKPDYEYLVWQEWKEGFARYIENRIQETLGLPLNNGGIEQPYKRVSFYPAGAGYIDLITREDSEVIGNLPTLFRRILQPN
jgi:hypothetical protein